MPVRRGLVEWVGRGGRYGTRVSFCLSRRRISRSKGRGSSQAGAAVAPKADRIGNADGHRTILFTPVEGLAGCIVHLRL